MHIVNLDRAHVRQTRKIASLHIQTPQIKLIINTHFCYRVSSQSMGGSRNAFYLMCMCFLLIFLEKVIESLTFHYRNQSVAVADSQWVAGKWIGGEDKVHQKMLEANGQQLKKTHTFKLNFKTKFTVLHI